MRKFWTLWASSRCLRYRLMERRACAQWLQNGSGIRAAMIDLKDVCHLIWLWPCAERRIVQFRMSEAGRDGCGQLWIIFQKQFQRKRIIRRSIWQPATSIGPWPFAPCGRAPGLDDALRDLRRASEIEPENAYAFIMRHFYRTERVMCTRQPRCFQKLSPT